MRRNCGIFPKLYKMLTKYSNTSQFDVQAQGGQKVGNTFQQINPYPVDRWIAIYQPSKKWNLDDRGGRGCVLAYVWSTWVYTIEKFTARWVNSTLNFMRKTDITVSAISVFQVKLTWNSLVRQRIFFFNRIGKTKHFLFLWAVPVHKQWHPFKANVNCIFSYFWVNGFLKFSKNFKSLLKLLKAVGKYWLWNTAWKKYWFQRSHSAQNYSSGNILQLSWVHHWYLYIFFCSCYLRFFICSLDYIVWCFMKNWKQKREWELYNQRNVIQYIQ